MTTVGKFTPVASCRSVEVCVGGKWVRLWRAVLTCGATHERVMQAKPGGKIRPAPLKARCGCPKCR